MAEDLVIRGQYWEDPENQQHPRADATGHGESLTDMERYLLPLERVRGTSLYSPGVADGLGLRAVTGQPGVRVLPGNGLDDSGRVVLLVAGGAAVVDPGVDPDAVANVPTVPVTADGVVLTSAGLGGEFVVTATHREVLGFGVLASGPVLVHAPWLRLEPVTGFTDLGQIVLGRVSVDPDGAVTALSGQGRVPVGVPAGGVELRAVRAQGTTVEHAAVARLAARSDGGVDLAMLSGATSTAALTVSAGGELTASRDVSIGGALHLRGATRDYATSIESDGAWRLRDSTDGIDRLVVTPLGSLGIGVAPDAVRRPLHVETGEIHSGGSAGGFSFSDRTVGGFLDVPSSGERWVWYAMDGEARLWSGGDRLRVSATGEGGGLDVGRRMRVRQGGDGSAGIWLFQRDTNADRAFVGMLDDTHVGFWGNTGAGWGLRMNTTSGSVAVNRMDVASRMRVRQGGDLSAGVWFHQSTPNQDRAFVGMADDTHVGFWGNTGAGWALRVDTTSGTLDVGSTGTGIVARGGTGAFHAGVLATGNLGVWATGNTTGILATGKSWAGSFNGNVLVTGVIVKGGGGFKIDHPLDPANKYLAHSFVESPEMLNVYVGTAVTGEDGQVEVALPDFFEALNRDFRYQLTSVGDLAVAAVARPIERNRFTIHTDKPGVTVSWQVTGVRQDAWADAYRLVVEEDKPEEERDTYLHPEVHHQPPERGFMRLMEP